ncbi:MAG: type II toxin-antitoxin system HicA family toxin [Calditrichaeota bacterium]|nr:MAG: type II toxin-antitoxin system HicA family toxin [Calditrichota bacterium]
MKIPRDLSGEKLIKKLKKLGYSITRQTGSHIRLTFINQNSNEFHITIPNHSPIKVGTLNNILNDISEHQSLSKEQILKLIS